METHHACHLDRRGATILPIIVLLVAIWGGVPLFGQLADRGFVISERIGSTIDSVERSYFNLFPDLSGFDSATVTVSADSMVRFAIVLRNNGVVSDTIRSVPVQTAHELGRFIDQFEHLFQEPSPAIDWKSIWTVVRPIRTFNDVGMQLVLTTRSGEEIRGLLVHADDRGAVLYPGTAVTDWSALGRESRFVPATEIGRIADDRSSISRLVGELDIPMQGNPTVYQNDVLPAIRSRGLFTDYVSPEIYVRIHGGNSSLPERTAPESTDEIYRPFAFRRLHLTVSTVGGVNMSAGQFLEFSGGRSVPTSVRMSVPSWRIGVDCDIFPWVGLGVCHYFRPTSTGTSNDFEVLNGDVTEVRGRIVLVHRGLFFTTLLSRFECMVGIGGAYSAMTLYSHMRYNRPSFPARDDILGFDSWGWTVFGGVDYYLAPLVSLDAELHQTIMPSHHVDDIDMHDLGYGTYILMGHRSQEIQVRSTELLLSLRLHIL